MDSTFDPALLLGATLTDANTRRPPIPGGTVLRGTLGEPKARQTEGTKDTNRGEIYNWIDIPVELDLTQNPSVLHHCFGPDATEGKVTLTHSFRLDVTALGGLDMSPGKNNGLRRLREAVDMNRPGEPFVISMVQGRQVLATISNRAYEGETYDGIGAIAKP